MNYGNIVTYSFRVESKDISTFRKKSQRGGKLPKSAPADVLRTFVKAYNKNPKLFNDLLK